MNAGETSAITHDQPTYKIEVGASEFIRIRPDGPDEKSPLIYMHVKGDGVSRTYLSVRQAQELSLALLKAINAIGGK